MSQKVIIETIGTIEKKESLVPVKYRNLVLETVAPFPGYHGTTVPDTSVPSSLFFITRSRYTEEKIIRLTTKIKKERKLDFDGSPGMVNLYNMLNPCIRIKDVGTYDKAEEVMKAYEEEGVEFMNYRKVEPYSGIIRVKKYFLLNPLTDCTFVDVEDPAMHYFTIQIQLRWNQFEKMTMNIKRNLENPNFDGALGSFYRKTGVVDVIRIYDENGTPERIKEIRTKYAHAIKKLMK